MVVSKAWKDKSSLVQIALVCIGFFLAFSNILGQLVQIWYTDEDYSHGFLIAPISLALLWMRRRSLAGIPPEPNVKLGMPLLALALFLYVIGTYAEVITLAALSMIMTLAALTICYFGVAFLKRLLFPLCFLGFMVPIPAQIYSSITLPLQLLVSRISVSVVTLVGIPVYRDGNILQLPNTTLQVVQACSGLRSMISLSALSALYALTAPRYPIRILVFLAAVPISIIVNVFRVSVTAYLSYRVGPEAAEGTAHELLGISVFLLSLVLLYFWKTILTGIASWIRKM